MFICKAIVLIASGEACALSQSVVVCKDTLVGAIVTASGVTTLLSAHGPKINQTLSLPLTLTIPIIRQMRVRVERVTQPRSKQRFPLVGPWQ